MASLFQACKAAVRNKQGGTFNIGGYDIDIEMYGQQDIDDDIQYGDVAFGDSDESKIVLVANDTITIPAGYTLTTDKPKKSLVIFCNTLVNNGTISMYQKAPNVLPHDYYIIQGNIIGSNRNVIIPAYANNASNAVNGINGTDRNCGSGGTGLVYDSGSGNKGPIANLVWAGVPLNTLTQSGSGYAFGGGAGVGGCCISRITSSGTDKLGHDDIKKTIVNSTYPMRGGAATRSVADNYYGTAIGGAGNPNGGINFGVGGIQSGTPPFGCGGRIIIFCNTLINNDIITVNGTDSYNIDPTYNAIGGASGAGAIDIFYTGLLTEGTITANGGTGYNGAGSGGDGSITLTQWNLDKVIKEERKMFTKDNWVYLFNNYSQRLREDVI